jgi:hypothetical protein
LNSPRKGCFRGMTICVWTQLGLTKGKMTSKKMEDDLKKNGRPPKKNGRRPQTKMKEDL